MNYNYNTQSDRELLVIQEGQEVLRYEAQAELLQVLKARGFASHALEASVQRKQDVVASLGYLKEMGYRVQTIDDKTVITRNDTPQLIDFFGSLLGVAFIFLGAKGVIELAAHFNSEDAFNLSLILVNGFLVVLGYFGVKMLSGFARFIDNLGMRFSFTKDTVVLEKRIEFKKETFKGTLEDVVIEASKNHLTLTFQGKAVLIGNSNSKVQQMTLAAVKSHLENNSSE